MASHGSRRLRAGAGSLRVRLATTALLALALALTAWIATAESTEPHDGYELAVGETEPVAQFRFDDTVGSSEVLDSAGSFTATNTGITLGGSGPFPGSKSGAFAVAGESRAKLPGNPLEGASAFSAEAWVKWEGGSSFRQAIFAFGASSSDYMMLTPAVSGTGHFMELEIHTSSGTMVASAPRLSSGKWEYVAVTESGSTVKIYLNGEVVGENTSAALSPSSLGSSSTAYLGKSLVSGDPGFKGSLSNVAFYTKALTPAQVLHHYYAANIPVVATAPSIAGFAKEGNVMKGKEGSWTGLAPAFSLRWQRCAKPGEPAEPSACPNIASATGSEYTVQTADIGSTLRLAVKAENAAGSAEAVSAQTETVTGFTPKIVTAPVISGTTAEGRLLSVSNGTWSGTPASKYSYQWERCPTKACTAISGATGSTYRLTSADVGVHVTATVTDESVAGNGHATAAEVGPVTSGAPVEVEAPTISGEAREGHELKASPGTWAGTATITYAYKWLRCSPSCAEVATGSSYTPVSVDVGHTLKLEVTASNGVGSTNGSSAPTSTVAGNPPSSTVAPTIAGEPREGHTLTAGSGSWSGTPPFTFEYLWESCEGASCAAIEGATSAEYTVGSADVGKTLRVKVTAKNSLGSATANSSQTTTVGGEPPANVTLPTISGTAKDGHTLTASSGSWSGATPISYAYQWQRCKESECTNVAGATHSTYTLVDGDLASTMQVRVTASNTLEPDGVATSAATETVTATPPAHTALPSVSGQALEGIVLRGARGSWEGAPAPTYTYRWLRCDALGESCLAISGATTLSYRLAALDVAGTVRLEVTAENIGGTTSALSPATSLVEAAGEAEAWGENFHSQLGTIYRDNREEAPVAVEKLNHITSIATGFGDNIAVLSNGHVATWGEDKEGELGDDEHKATWERGLTHTEAIGLSGVTQVAAANAHVLALREDGSIWTWGTNQFGQLGLGVDGFEVVTGIDERVPHEVPGLSGVVGVGAAGGSDFAILANGEVEAWGSNTFGQLGIEFPSACQLHNSENPECAGWQCETETGAEPCSTSPHLVEIGGEPLKEVVQITGGEEAAYALLANGHVMSWGADTFGQLGQAITPGGHSRFTEVGEVMRNATEPLEHVKELAGGYKHALALLENGHVVGWGDNEVGALGALASSTPACEAMKCNQYAAPIPGWEAVEAEQIGAGHGYSALLVGGEVQVVGSNEKSQLGNKLSEGFEGPENCLTEAAKKEAEEKGKTPNDKWCSREPALVAGLKHVRALSATDTHVVVLLKAGYAAPAPPVTVEPGKGTVTLHWTPTAERLDDQLFPRPGNSEVEEGGEGGASPEEIEEKEKEAEEEAIAEGAPRNVTAPHVSGKPRVGVTLTTKRGNWAGEAPLGYLYQWRRCKAGSCTLLGTPETGATTYTLTSADIGYTLQIVVTATNTKGSATAASPPTASIKATPEEKEKAKEEEIELEEKPEKVTITGLHEITISTLHGNALKLLPYEFKLKWGKVSHQIVMTPLP
jgi:alpha-tubulin suppressor-like RCC1 family protein